MKKQISLLLSLILVISTSCKTQEEIRREQLVDEMAVHVGQDQKTTTEILDRLALLEEKYTNFTGTIEEEKHSVNTQTQQLMTDIAVVKENHEASRKEMDLIKERMTALEKQANENQKYLKEVLSTLEKLTSKKKTSKLSLYDETMLHYRKAHYKTARKGLESLLDDKKIRGNRKARVLHNLGMIAYMDKRYDDAMVYFSRLFTEYPKAPYLPNGLLYLGKSFHEAGQKEQAIQTLEQLVSKYPKKKHAKQAKKLLAKLK